ncbi:MAG TPA: HAD family hydrolase [Patescibacteria group bacterium]|nr:HAD family hydrolase [Patescibacteria group bacterium]
MTNTPVEQVIFDLDSTLLDTEKIKVIFAEIAAQYGITDPQEVRKVYRSARTENQEGKKIAADLDSFLGAIEKTVGQEVNRGAAMKYFEERSKEGLLIPGAEELVRACDERRLSKQLLSLGVQEWQEWKIRLAGLDKYFSTGETIFTRDTEKGKIEVLQELWGQNYQGERTLLFNDKPEETERLMGAFPGLRVFLRREERDTRYKEEDFVRLQEKMDGRLVWSDDLSVLKTEMLALLNPEKYDGERR